MPARCAVRSWLSPRALARPLQPDPDLPAELVPGRLSLVAASPCRRLCWRREPAHGHTGMAIHRLLRLLWTTGRPRARMSDTASSVAGRGPMDGGRMQRPRPTTTAALDACPPWCGRDHASRAAPRRPAPREPAATRRRWSPATPRSTPTTSPSPTRWSRGSSAGPTPTRPGWRSSARRVASVRMVATLDSARRLLAVLHELLSPALALISTARRSPSIHAHLCMAGSPTIEDVPSISERTLR